MNGHLWVLIIGLGVLNLPGCGQDKCVANRLESCAVTMNIRYVCGCDGVTYVNASEAECHEIFTYTEGACEDQSF